jgi:hypothetical protein
LRVLFLFCAEKMKNNVFKTHRLFVFVFIMSQLVLSENGCNRAGFSGPSCQFLDCGKNGVLNSNGFSCDCDYGFTGARCEECKTMFKDASFTREYLCCPFSLAETVSDDMQWWLIAPKLKHSVKFLSGAFTSVNCLRPGSSFYQNKTSEYFLDCNCKLYIPTEKRKRVFDHTEDDAAKSLLSVKRDARSQPSSMEVFWKNEVEKRNEKQKSFISPSILADILMNEYTNTESKTLASATLALQKKNATAYFCASSNSSSLSEGETWVIVLCSVFIAIVWVVVIAVCWCFINYKRVIYNIWKTLNASPTKLEDAVTKLEGINARIKLSKKYKLLKS